MRSTRHVRDATSGALRRGRARSVRSPRVQVFVLLLVVAVGVTALVLGSSGDPSSGHTGETTQGREAAAAGRTLIFAEDFDDELDAEVWADCYHTADVDGCTNPWNEELQWYHPDQRSVADGHLALTLEERPYRTAAGETFDYRSGMVTTQPGFEFTYGYVEFSADYPVGQGVWPALWMLPASKAWPPELDVLEVVGHEPDIAYFNVHFPQDKAITRSDGSTTTGAPGAATIEGLSEGFHTFGLLWQPDRLEWYVDGVLQHRFTDLERIPDEPMYLVMNVATGGAWAGAPDETTPLPAQLLVDDVRVWQ